MIKAHDRKQTPHHHFRDAPKLVRTFFISLASLSLSPASAPATTFLLRSRGAPPAEGRLEPPALVGVGWLLPPKLALTGVGAWLEPGVVAESEAEFIGLYEMLEREKTRCCSGGPALRRWAAAAWGVPLV